MALNLPRPPASNVDTQVRATGAVVCLVVLHVLLLKLWLFAVGLRVVLGLFEGTPPPPRPLIETLVQWSVFAGVVLVLVLAGTGPRVRLAFALPTALVFVGLVLHGVNAVVNRSEWAVFLVVALYALLAGWPVCRLPVRRGGAGKTQGLNVGR